MGPDAEMDTLKLVKYLQYLAFYIILLSFIYINKNWQGLWL